MGTLRKGRRKMKSEKLKRYQVTQSLRFQSNIIKGFFYAGLILLPLGIIIAVLGIFVQALEPFRGIAIIAAVLSVIWLFSAKFMSETNFGLANVSFTQQGIIFRTGGANSVDNRLDWNSAVCCGMEKTRWSWWCYVSDHELSAKERKEFPEFVEKGVFYFNYADNTWEEMMKFLPEKFKPAMEEAWSKAFSLTK